MASPSRQVSEPFCRFVVSEGNTSMLPNDRCAVPTEGFLIRYDIEIKSNNPSGGLQVQKAHMIHRCFREDFQPSCDTESRNFLNRNHIPFGVQQEILEEVEKEGISLANHPLNAAPKLLIIHADISTWASHPGEIEESQIDDSMDDLEEEYDDLEEEEEGEYEDVEDEVLDEDEDMDTVVSSSMEDYNNIRCPAARFAIELLDRAKFGGGIKEIIATCTVCFEEFMEMDEVIMMPCKHVYHEECILRWLEQSNLCPLCRCAMPVDRV